MAKVLVIYSVGKGITGQLAASLMLVDILRGEGLQVEELKLPALDRNQRSRVGARLVYLLRLLWAWLRAPLYLRYRPDYVYLNVGQTPVALLRDLVPFKLFAWLTTARGVVSLHGNVFMAWKRDSLTCRLFRTVLRSASAVTVLGAQQRGKLVSIGIPEHKVYIVPNTCDLEPQTEVEVMIKQQQVAPLRFMFFSNLIDSKGYPEFLEAMEIVAEKCDRPIEVTFCGKLYADEPSDRFASNREREEWIDQKIHSINSFEQASASWIKGAYGNDKAVMFRRSHIFVFPSQYSVEAQPIVLLEAMASGLAIITADVGEIRETVGDAGIVHSDPNPQIIAKEALRLASAPYERLMLAQRGLDLFNRKYSKICHAEVWKKILELIADN